MKIVKLIAENVKKLKAVEIAPDGSLIVIGGKNAAGKSSVLDAILAAFAGKKELPPKMLRDGQEKGFIEIELDEYIIRRSFTEKGGSLKITNKDGAIFPSPQTMLNKLIGKISFDPLRFVNMTARDQVELLKNITGLDFEPLDEDRSECYEHRAASNREIKRLQGEVDGLKGSMPGPKDNMPERVSVQDLMRELDEAQKTNAENRKQEQELVYCESAINNAETDCETIQSQIKQLQAQLKEKRAEIEKHKENRDQLENIVCALEDVDEAEIKQKINSAQDINSFCDRIDRYKQLVIAVEEQKKRSETLTKNINGIDQRKVEMVQKSKLPIENLSFDTSGVQYNGLPFEQASQAEQLQVSVALGLAANPKLKVLLIKDGSLLDEDNLKIVGDMAEKNDAQIWLERVGEGKEVSIVMEDGQVKEVDE